MPDRVVVYGTDTIGQTEIIREEPLSLVLVTKGHYKGSVPVTTMRPSRLGSNLLLTVLRVPTPH